MITKRELVIGTLTGITGNIGYAFVLGLKEQSLFPEISYEEVDLVKGMNVSIITTANTDDEARELLRLLGMPFKK